MTKKQILEAQQNYRKECEIDDRTLPMIVHHYISIGEQVALNLTDEKIEKVYQSELQKQQEAEKKGSIYMITPEFQKYILVACQKLAKLEPDVRYDLIKHSL